MRGIRCEGHEGQSEKSVVLFTSVMFMYEKHKA